MSESYGAGEYAPLTEVEYAEHLEREMIARDWFAPLRNELEEQFKGINDPSAYLIRVYDLMEETADEYYQYEVIEYLLEKEEWLLSLLTSDIPNVPDIAYVVLSDFLIISPECGGDVPRAKAVHEKMYDILFNNDEIFMSADSCARADFGLRLSTLARMRYEGDLKRYELRQILTQIDEHTEDSLDKVILKTAQFYQLSNHAHHASLALMKAPVPLDKRTGLVTNRFLGSMHIEELLADVSRSDIDTAAHGMSVRFGAPLDMRLQRNTHHTEEEQEARHYKHLREWMGAMLELEAHARGACEVLHQRFGILNFHHYPINVLKQQYDERDMDVPYGVVISARFDHNDVFVPYYLFYKDEKPVLSELSKQLLQKGMRMRIFEVENKRDFAKRLAQCDRQYGKQNKISYAFVRAHGGEEETQLGNKYGQSIKKKDLLKLRSGHAASYFVPGSDMLVESCYAGKEGGIAEASAEVLGVRVQAAEDVSLGYKKIHVEWNGNLPRFTPVPRKEGEIIQTYNPTATSLVGS
jgi:hypothetical protein